MTAAPGWYDAGTPGELRWWDGTRWTGQVAAAGPIVGPTPPHRAPAPSTSPTGSPSGPQPGWYPAGSDQLRWWDGSHWTGLRVKDGKPGTDWATTEQPTLAWVFASVFLVLALLQFSLGLLSSHLSVNGVPLALVSILWFGIAAKTTAVRRIPRPTGEPTVIDAVRPLPGEQDGPGAGWYDVSSRATRWWTGSRWAQYVGTQYGVRPTFHGARAFRTYLVLCWVILGIGVLGLIVGVVLVINSSDDSYAFLGAAIGIVVIAGGVLFGVLGGVLLAMSRTQRRLLLLPELPPGR